MCKPLISVVIPAYNHERYIQETIKSIINQTYENIELIIVDDGSTDSTWQKMQEMKEECDKRFTRVLFETKINEGSCKTLNQLVKLAKGEYLYMNASDDITKPQIIEKEFDFLANNKDYALCVGDDEIIDDEGNTCYWDKDRNIVYDINKAKYKTFKDFLQSSRKDFNFLSNKFGTYETLYIGNYIPNGFLIRKSIFEKIGYFTSKAPLEDYWLMLQISKYAKIKYLNEILYSYRWHSNNTIKDNEKMTNLIERTLLYEEIIRKNCLDKNDNDLLPNALFCIRNGSLIKKWGIPYVFQLLTYKKFNCKIKILKLFNFKILQYEKNKI